MHEIDGVRGIALALVVLFHLFGNGRVSGGVDVFLVISAYFLTRKLLTRFDQSSTLNANPPRSGIWLGKHFTGVIARLVPSAVIVLAAVLVGTLLFTSPTQYLPNLREILASALYYENWELISSQLAYEAAGPNTSPLQHFWSLSVQGQFFLFWPLIGFLIFFVSRRLGWKHRRAFLAVATSLTVLSFIYALVLVQADQQVAYFSTFTRFWELGAGALIAFIPAQMLSHRFIRESFVGTGIAMIVFCGFLFDGAAVFPGLETLWPVGATLLVLFGASRDTPSGFASVVLGAPAVNYLSKISYPLYLWHWPLLVFYLQIRERSHIGPVGAALILILSILLAVATQWLVSRRWVAPPKMSLSWRTLVVPVLGTSILASSVIWLNGAELSHRHQLEAAAKNHSEQYPGALALTGAETAAGLDHDVPPFPSFESAYDDKPSVYSHGCIQSHRDEPGTEEVLVCDVDNYGSSRTVVMTGGSHVVHWYPALQTIAREQGWRLIVIEKSSCRLSTSVTRDSCIQWNRNALEVISSYEPDLVFTLGTLSSVRPGELDRIEKGSIEIWNALAKRGIPTIGVRDLMRVPFRVPDCLLENDGLAAPCAVPRDEVFSPDILATAESPLPSSFELLDLSDAVCAAETCEPIVGNMVVYRDGQHLTASYARTTAPMLEQAMREAMPSLFE